MSSTPASLEELFRSLGLTLTIRAAPDEPGAWACTLSRPDGRTYEIESVTFFDVDPDTGEEWEVEPAPSRVLGVLAGGDVESEEAEGDGAAADDRAGNEAGDGAAEAEAAARAFLGDDAYELLLRLDEEGLDQG